MEITLLVQTNIHACNRNLDITLSAHGAFLK